MSKNDRERIEIRVIGKGQRYRVEEKVGTSDERGSLSIIFAGKPSIGQGIWPFVRPDYYKGFKLGQEVLCFLEVTGKDSWRLIGIVGISKKNESGLPIIDPDTQIGDVTQPGTDSIIWDARQFSDRKKMPKYYPN